MTDSDNMKRAIENMVAHVDSIRAQFERCADDRETLARALVQIASVWGACDCRRIAEAALHKVRGP